MFREKNNRSTTNYYIHVQYFLICIYQKTYWLASKYLIIFSNLHSFFSKFSFMMLFYVDFLKSILLFFYWNFEELFFLKFNGKCYYQGGTYAKFTQIKR